MSAGSAALGALLLALTLATGAAVLLTLVVLAGLWLDWLRLTVAAAVVRLAAAARPRCSRLLPPHMRRDPRPPASVPVAIGGGAGRLTGGGAG